MKKPHVVLALEFPLAFGSGVSVIVRTLLQELREDFRLSLVSPDTTEDLAKLGLAEVLEQHQEWHVERASAARARLLAETLRGWRADLVHFHFGQNYGWGNRRPGTSPFPLLQTAGVRCVTTVHYVTRLLTGLLPEDAPWWKYAAALPVAWTGKMLALRATDCELAVSDHDLHKLRAWYAPLRARFRRVYHSQLPLASAAPGGPREAVILHAGHRATRKGQHILAEAFAQVAPEFPQWRLHLVGPPGEDAYEAALQAVRERHELSNRITIEGNRPDLPALLARAEVYAQPSLGEALGLALQEALFHGCACLGTWAGGIPELIAPEQNGLLVPPGDVPALAAALRRLLGDAALRERLRAAGPASLAQRGMSAAAMVEAHRQLYREVLRG